jgi:hypothetical protein
VNSQQVKQKLELYRPGVDDTDPQFADALAETKRDAELQRWFDERCALYAVVRAKLGEVTAPAELRGRILTERKIIHPVIWWQNPFVLAAAAAVAMTAVMAWFLFPLRQPADLGGFRQAMVRSVSGEYKMMLETNDLNQIRDFLAKNQAQADYQLTAALERTPAEGCTILDWHGHKVSLLCFDLGNDNDLWLFIVDRTALPDAPATESPQFAGVGKMATASWSQGDSTYLLAVNGDTEKLRKYL